MTHIERFRKKIRKRSGSLAGSESSESAPGVQATSPAEPSQPHTNQKYGLFELKPDKSRAQPARAEQYPVDIIAVHGLNGDPYKTWTHSATGKLWLRDFIPDFLPGSRAVFGCLMHLGSRYLVA